MDEPLFTGSRFCWWDLGTTDTAAARKFYGELFGWEAADNPMPEAGDYTIFTKNGKDAGAVFPIGEEMTAQGVPPHWQSYVSVDDIDQAVRKAKELNGNVIEGPFDVMDIGRQAVIADPDGAVLSLWEPKGFRGSSAVGDVGGVCWNELATRDLAVAGEFYGNLFSWKPERMPMGTEDYMLLKTGENTAAGAMQMDDKWGDVPPHWLPYFQVANAEQTVETAGKLGAEIIVAPQDIPDIGMFSVIKDPQGAVFAILGPNKA